MTNLFNESGFIVTGIANDVESSSGSSYRVEFDGEDIIIKDGNCPIVITSGKAYDLIDSFGSDALKAKYEDFEKHCPSSSDARITDALAGILEGIEEEILTADRIDAFIDGNLKEEKKGKKLLKEQSQNLIDALEEAKRKYKRFDVLELDHQNEVMMEIKNIKTDKLKLYDYMLDRYIGVLWITLDNFSLTIDFERRQIVAGADQGFLNIDYQISLLNEKSGIRHLLRFYR